jgi:hypothetical protein
MQPAAYREVLVALPVAGNDIMSLAFEALGQVRGDEAPCACNTDAQLLLRPVRLKGVLCKA